MKKFAILILLMLTFILTSCGNNREYKATTDSSDIALLTIYTFDGKAESNLGLMNLGHSFLSIENLSDEKIMVQNKPVLAGETICVGTWSIKDHFGVWYNVESNYISEYNKYDGRVSVTIGIDENDLITISDFISSTDMWNPINNCSFFASNLWNKVAKDSEKLNIGGLLYTPAKLQSEIKKFDTFEVNREIVTTKDFGYFDNSTYISHTWHEEVAV